MGRTTIKKAAFSSPKKTNQVIKEDGGTVSSKAKNDTNNEVPKQDKNKKEKLGSDSTIDNGASFFKQAFFILLASVAGVVLGSFYERYSFNSNTVSINEMIRELNETPKATLLSTSADNFSTNSVTESQDYLSKYKSYIVSVKPQLFLPRPPNEENIKCLKKNEIEVISPTERINITNVTNNYTTNDLREKGLVFIMLNGENDGLFVKWNEKKHEKCLYQLANVAALALGVLPERIANGLTMRTQMGKPIITAQEIDQDAGRIIHVLLDFQLWVWPGIRIGHVYNLENGMNMTTISLKPLVYDVVGFFNDTEADDIVKIGLDHLQRSPVDGEDATAEGYHADRTSYTAFLNDTNFTRDFRKRTTDLVRLPSPSFAERLQLVRYETGQFFRKHEDYFESKQFLPAKSEIAWDLYYQWTAYVGNQIRTLLSDKETAKLIPEGFGINELYFPQNNVSDASFNDALVRNLMNDVNGSTFFEDKGNLATEKWILENLENNADGVFDVLMDTEPWLLKHMIQAWERKSGLEDRLRFEETQRPINGVSQYFRWIQWAKERIGEFKDENGEYDNLPENIRPSGQDYPRYTMEFQNQLVNYMFEEFSDEVLIDALNEEWYYWIKDDIDTQDVLLEALKYFPSIVPYVIQAWESRIVTDKIDFPFSSFHYDIPKYIKHFEPNRFVTLFLYLNDVPEGGETVFPYSKEILVTNIERKGMKECSKGLAVPARKLHASLFYAQTPEGDVNPLSLHGGCPPAKGIKYGANSFVWNTDADEGAGAWGMD